MSEPSHECKWGPVEESRFTGNPHRKCQVDGCRNITLDLDDDPADPLDDDRDQENPCEFSEDYDWSKWDFDNDPDWR